MLNSKIMKRKSFLVPEDNGKQDTEEPYMSKY